MCLQFILRLDTNLKLDRTNLFGEAINNSYPQFAFPQKSRNKMYNEMNIDSYRTIFLRLIRSSLKLNLLTTK